MGATNQCQCVESKKKLGTYVCGDKCINKDKICERHSDCKAPEKTENIAKLKYLKYKMKYINLSKKQILNESSSLNFVNKEPLEILPILKEEIGEPSIQSNKSAYLEWEYNNDGFRHVLRDEAIAHCVPAPHIDFLYTFTYYYLDPLVIPTVQKISASVLIDLLKNEIGARCGSTAANYATLYTIIKISQMILTNTKLPDIESYYSNNIFNKDKNKERNKQFVKNESNKNKMKYSNSFLSYHPYNTPRGCPN
jgi:hypothetical protein